MIDGPVRPLRSRRGDTSLVRCQVRVGAWPDPDSSEIASPDHDPGPYRGQPNRRRVRADRGHSSNTPTLCRSSRKITAAPHARAGIGADHDDVLLLGRHGRFGRWRLLSVEVRHRRARRIPTAIGLPAADGAGRRAAARLVRSNPMSALAPALQAYFTGRLNSQRAASPNTIAADKHASRLLLAFAARRTDATPSHWDSNAAAAARTSSAARRSRSIRPQARVDPSFDCAMDHCSQCAAPVKVH